VRPVPGREGDATSAPELDVVVPAHNEAESIQSTLRGIGRALAGSIRHRIVACEDGSEDGTSEKIRELIGELPILLLSEPGRRGYSGAVLAGIRASRAPYLLFMDADGQCEPTDAREFWRRRAEADVVAGFRFPRSDPFRRRLFSRLFYWPYRLATGVRRRDPSCPFVLCRREVVERLAPDLGAMPDGFWWEFSARAVGAGFSVIELPVRHHVRAAGATRVYGWRRIPRIAWRETAGLCRVLLSTRRRRRPSDTA